MFSCFSHDENSNPSPTEPLLEKHPDDLREIIIEQKQHYSHQVLMDEILASTIGASDLKGGKQRDYGSLNEYHRPQIPGKNPQTIIETMEGEAILSKTSDLNHD
jgi:hypothetical protein